MRGDEAEGSEGRLRSRPKGSAGRQAVWPPTLCAAKALQACLPPAASCCRRCACGRARANNASFAPLTRASSSNQAPCAQAPTASPLRRQLPSATKSPAASAATGGGRLRGHGKKRFDWSTFRRCPLRRRLVLLCRFAPLSSPLPPLPPSPHFSLRFCFLFSITLIHHLRCRCALAEAGRQPLGGLRRPHRRDHDVL